MKFFLDTANLEEIREVNSWGVLRGITTNPTLISKEDQDFLPLVADICSIVDGDVSVETASDDPDVLIAQGREIARIADNAIVKIAMTRNGLAAITALTREHIRVNVTLVFSATQAILAAEAGAYIVSPFLGRLDDIGTNGLAVLADVCEIFRVQHYRTQVLAASLRHPIHVIEAARLGADIVTLPFSVMAQLSKHPLTDSGFHKFISDWEQARPHLGELPSSYQ